MASTQNVYGESSAWTIVIGVVSLMFKCFLMPTRPSLANYKWNNDYFCYGKVFRKPPHDALQAYLKRRRRGRPKLIWAVEVKKIAIQVTDDNLYSAMTDEQQWKKRVRKFCRAPCSTPLAAWNWGGGRAEAWLMSGVSWVIVYGISFNWFIFFSFEGHLSWAFFKTNLIVCILLKNTLSGDENILCEHF